MRARVVELAGTKRCPTRPNGVVTREAQIVLAPQSRPLRSRLTRGQGDASALWQKEEAASRGKVSSNRMSLLYAVFGMFRLPSLSAER